MFGTVCPPAWLLSPPSPREEGGIEFAIVRPYTQMTFTQLAYALASSKQGTLKLQIHWLRIDLPVHRGYMHTDTTDFINIASET